MRTEPVRTLVLAAVLQATLGAQDRAPRLPMDAPEAATLPTVGDLLDPDAPCGLNLAMVRARARYVATHQRTQVKDVAVLILELPELAEAAAGPPGPPRDKAARRWRENVAKILAAFSAYPGALTEARLRAMPRPADGWPRPQGQPNR